MAVMRSGIWKMIWEYRLQSHGLSSCNMLGDRLDTGFGTYTASTTPICLGGRRMSNITMRDSRP